jgi:hypothetical protein
MASSHNLRSYGYKNKKSNKKSVWGKVANFYKKSNKKVVLPIFVLLFATFGYTYYDASRAETITSTTMGALSLYNVHDIVYDGVTFDGAGSGGADSSGVIFIMGNTYNITFKNCTIMPNRDGVGNGIKIYDTGGVHDITFENCHIMQQPRMGFEAIGRGSGDDDGGGYYHVNLYNNVFEPQCSEAVSYDGGSATGNSVVSGNIVKGSGNCTTSQNTWDQGFEINGPTNMTVKNNVFYAGKGSTFNLNGHGYQSNWTITNNIIDTSVLYQSTPMSSESSPVEIINVSGSGSTFANNTIIGTAGWTLAWVQNVNNTNWSGTKWYSTQGLGISAGAVSGSSNNNWGEFVTSKPSYTIPSATAPSSTPTPTSTPTSTPRPTSTPTPTPIPTSTPRSTPTPTPYTTPTPTLPVAIVTPTDSPKPTAVVTPTPTPTSETPSGSRRLVCRWFKVGCTTRYVYHNTDQVSYKHRQWYCLWMCHR